MSFSSDLYDAWCFRTNTNVPSIANPIKTTRMIRLYVHRRAKAILYEEKFCAFNLRLAVGCFVFGRDTIRACFKSHKAACRVCSWLHFYLHKISIEIVVRVWARGYGSLQNADHADWVLFFLLSLLHLLLSRIFFGLVTNKCSIIF